MTSRPGIALILALLVLLLVEAMTVGVLALATHAQAVAASQTRSTRADAAAELAVSSLLGRWETTGFDTLPVGATVQVANSPGQVADVRVSASVERVSGATYLVRGFASVGGASLRAEGRAVAMARTLDRSLLLEESNAAASSGGPVVIAGASTISGLLGTLPETWSDTLCPATDPLPFPRALLSADAATVGDDATIAGPVAVDTLLRIRDSVALGGVKWSELTGLADQTASGTVVAGPQVTNGTCVLEAAGNWGDPEHPSASCGTYFPLIYADGDLVVQGVGQGILAVNGTLTLAAGARFTGVVVARDGVTLEAGSVVFGAVRSRGGAFLIDAAKLAYSRCVVSRVAVRTPSATRLILAQRRFIPAF